MSASAAAAPILDGDGGTDDTAAYSRPRRGLGTHRRWFTPWLFVALALAVVGGFLVLPFLGTLRLSVTDATLLRPGSFIGLENFRDLFADPRFRTALLNSSLYVVCVVPFMMVLPLILAALLAKSGPLIGFFRTSMYLPVVMSSVVVGLIWTSLLDKRGLINESLATLKAITEPIPFLTDRWLLLFSAMVVTIWTGLGYYMVIYLSALANIDPALYEAAALDGAGTVQQFLHVTMPGVRSTMGLIGILSSVAAFRVFGEIYVLSNGTGGVGGQDLTMTMLIQLEGTGLQARTGYAAAISMVMFVVLGTLLAVQLYAQNRGDEQ
ncbi:carbohydrate ABC transporter permease [Schaalia naturae]|uniref:carbohydrate ABC transporter permease n=1 Tax=Schaalia naturae TaxID=635203 RepID=UPI00362E4332